MQDKYSYKKSFNIELIMCPICGVYMNKNYPENHTCRSKDNNEDRGLTAEA